MTHHPDPELFAARLHDLRDLHAGDLAYHLELANERGTLLDEINAQLRQDGRNLLVASVLLDMLEDLDAVEAAADAKADLEGELTERMGMTAFVVTEKAMREMIPSVEALLSGPRTVYRNEPIDLWKTPARKDGR